MGGKALLRSMIVTGFGTRQEKDLTEVDRRRVGQRFLYHGGTIFRIAQLGHFFFELQRPQRTPRQGAIKRRAIDEAEQNADATRGRLRENLRPASGAGTDLLK